MDDPNIYASLIKGTILREVAKSIFSVVTNQLKTLGMSLKTSQHDMLESISHHLREVKNWSEEITFKDLKGSKKTHNVFIELDFFLYPRRSRLNASEYIKSFPIGDVFKYSNSQHVAILGQVGAGKTTSMKYFCQQVLTNPGFYPNELDFPILLRLREFNKPVVSPTSNIIIEHLFILFGFEIKNFANSQSDVLQKIKEKIIVQILNTHSVLVIIEGFDELVVKKYRSMVLEELPRLANQVEKSRIIITSRSSDYVFSFENIQIFELSPLTEDQVEQFANRWLQEEDAAESFLRDIKKSPFSDTTIRPLTIAHLCAIYERSGSIPEKPKTVYRKIVNLLIEEWDEQRNIKRKSKYASFEIDRKFEFLSSLAFYLTTSYKSSVFSKNELKNVYKRICLDFDLDLREANTVVSEIESHTGLFIESSYSNYEFAHKSLQEYLTAEYIVKLPSLIKDRVKIEPLANELAIAVSISSNASLYFEELVSQVISKTKLSGTFIKSFVNRLLLEKPEFNQNHRLGFAALSLYSQYLDVNLKNSQLTLFVVDELVKEFESFIENIFKRNSNREILRYYKITDKSISVNSTEVLTLELIKKSGRDKDWHLPRFLYCRKSFLRK